MVTHAELPSFPFVPGPLSAAPAEYAERRATCPFGRVRLRSGHEAILLVTYADAVQALADVRLSHDLTAPGSPRLADGPSFRDDPEVILNLEGEKHLRIRRLTAAAFAPRSIERWRPMIHAAASELIDQIEQGPQPVDLIGAFCARLPVRVIGTLLGLPEQDTDRFQEWSDAFALATAITDEERKDRLGEFHQYLVELLAARRAAPGDSLVDDLIAARDGADKLGEEELIFLVMALIVAGTHTTSNSLGRGLLTMLRDGGRLWKRLAAHPESAAPAVDELLRYDGLGDLLHLRLAKEDVQLPSGTVKKGEAVVVSVISALNDEAQYKDPHTVRFDREGAAQLIFGGGPHFCPGSHLAKAELQISFGLLAERLPHLRLAVDQISLRFTEGEELSSLLSLPVMWSHDAANSV